MATRDPASTQSVERALLLLSQFSAPHLPDGVRRTRWTVSDLARKTGIHKSVVGRLMATMAKSGYVVQDPVTRSYTVGPEAFAVGEAYEPYSALHAVAHARMEQLTAECGHACYLLVSAGNEIMVVVGVESQRSLRVTYPTGQRFPYHVTANGKILLSGMDDDRVREILGPGPLEQLTPDSIVDPEVFIEELREIRQTGVALNHNESVLGSGTIAVGIRNADGDIVAGLGIVYPTHNVTEADISEWSKLVMNAAADISAKLGGPIGIR